MRVIPTTFSALFGRDLENGGLDKADGNPFDIIPALNINRIDVPLFQRKYCWSDDHCKALIEDLEKGSDRGQEHHLGKIFVMNWSVYSGKPALPSPGQTRLIVVDGQQRITTNVILMCAMRDVADLVLAKMKSHEGSLEFPQDLCSMFSHLSSRINRLLFTSDFDFTNLQSFDWQKKRGKVFPHSVFVPTFDDRAEFFDVLLGNVSPLPLPPLRISDSSSRVIQSKLVFNAHFLSVGSRCISSQPIFDFLFSQSATDRENIVVFLEQKEMIQKGLMTLGRALTKIFEYQMHQLKMVLIEMDQTMEAQNYFNQLSCVGLANQIQFKIPRLGINMAQCDLIRNFVLGFFPFSDVDSLDEVGYEEEKEKVGVECGTCVSEIQKYATAVKSQVSVYFDLWLPTEELFPPPHAESKMDSFLEFYVHQRIREIVGENEYKKIASERKEQMRAFRDASLLAKMTGFATGQAPSLSKDFKEYIYKHVLRMEPPPPVIPGGTKPTVSDGDTRDTEQEQIGSGQTRRSGDGGDQKHSQIGDPKICEILENELRQMLDCAKWMVERESETH